MRVVNGEKTNTKDQSTEMAYNLADIALLLGRYENELQAHREHLTLRTDFNPESLFRYLTLGQDGLSRSHVIYFMEENGRSMREDESKMFFTVYGYKDRMSYADFLNYIYPFDADAVKTISTVHCKKYIKNDQSQPCEEVLCVFLLLVLKQIEFLHAFEEFKVEKFPNYTRDSIKKLVKVLKKFVPSSANAIASDTVFNFQEFKAVLKTLRNLPERKAQPICRRLSLQKESLIGIDQLEIWLKPWFKPKQEEGPQQHSQTLFEDLSESLIDIKD